MKLTFLGANRNVTGSRYCLEANGNRLMIDCGLVQEREFLDRNWAPCPIPAQSFKALLVTHAHIDHIGLIPKFVKDGFKGPIYATRPTAALAKVMLKDSAKIQAEDAKYKKRRHKKEGRKGPHPEVPLYTDVDVDRALKLFRGVDYRTPVQVSPEVTVTWHDAGHILGSASLEVTVEEPPNSRTFIFSGDIGQPGKPLINDPTFFSQADYVVMESTYGNRNHDDHGNIEEQLEQIIRKTVQRGGNVVIPVFAVERAQEMMYFISRLVHEDLIPDIPIFLDSPMAYDATTIFRQFKSWLDEETLSLIESNEPPLQFPGLRLTRTARESKEINQIVTPCIIMAPAGMCNAGRIKHHLRQNISRPESTIVFVGFQARDTLGRHLIEGAKEVRIHGRTHRVEAEIAQVPGLSGHADRQGLLKWLEHFERPPRKIFLTHGEAEAADALMQTIESKFGFDVLVPEFNTIVEFDDDGQSRVDTSAIANVPTKSESKIKTKKSPVNIQTPNAVPKNADFEFLDSSTRRPIDFLHQDPWRVLRIQSDTIQGIEVMARALEGRRRAVAVFGSARLPEDDPSYQLARETCRILGERGFAIITGGGPGIMEAANRGARESGAPSVGLNIDLPQEQKLNPFCDAAYECKYFFVRKMLFAKYAHGFVIFPGGFGTMDELFEALTLIQTDKLAHFPLVLADKDYWGPMVDWLNLTMREKGCIDEDELGLFVSLNDPNEIADLIDSSINGR